MKLRVQYSAQLRSAIGRTEDEVEQPEGSSLEALIHHLAAACEGAGPHLISADGQVHRSLLIVVNESPVAARNAAAIILRAGDIVALLPPIAGG
jgi:molybdopterin converting factor small subunit